MRFDDYRMAYDHARAMATTSGLYTVIRKTKEYGKIGYNVNFKSNDGSDYLAETITPSMPTMINRITVPTDADEGR